MKQVFIDEDILEKTSYMWYWPRMVADSISVANFVNII